MVLWSSSLLAPLTLRNRVPARGALPAATFSAFAICALIVLLSRLERLNDHCSTRRPRRVTICTATAPDAVRTLRTNRETTVQDFHAELLSDHHEPTPQQKRRSQGPAGQTILRDRRKTYELEIAGGLSRDWT